MFPKKINAMSNGKTSANKYIELNYTLHLTLVTALSIVSVSSDRENKNKSICLIEIKNHLDTLL